MKFLTVFGLLIASLISLEAWRTGYFGPRVTLTTYSEMQIIDCKITHYKWWAIGLYSHGDFSCIATFSEDRGNRLEDAVNCYKQTKACFSK